jgi:hypothetical protein
MEKEIVLASPLLLGYHLSELSSTAYPRISIPEQFFFAAAARSEWNSLITSQAEGESSSFSTSQNHENGITCERDSKSNLLKGEVLVFHLGTGVDLPPSRISLRFFNCIAPQRQTATAANLIYRITKHKSRSLVAVQRNLCFLMTKPNSL